MNVGLFLGIEVDDRLIHHCDITDCFCFVIGCVEPYPALVALVFSVYPPVIAVLIADLFNNYVLRDSSDCPVAAVRTEIHLQIICDNDVRCKDYAFVFGFDEL